MKNEEIKIECEQMYEQISAAEKRLKKIREICPHEITHEGIYSYRVGNYKKAELCSFCDALIKIIPGNPFPDSFKPYNKPTNDNKI